MDALLHNAVVFGRVLRRLGLPMTSQQVADLAQVFTLVDLARQDEVRDAARAVLVRRREQIALFELAFAWFWRIQHALDPAAALDTWLAEQPQQRKQYGTSGGAAPLATSDDQVADRTAAYSAVELLRHKDFAHLSDDERILLRQALTSLTWRPPVRRTRRTFAASHGAQIDLRRTLRQSVRTGGHPLRLTRRASVIQRRPLVILCDVSGSMLAYSRVLLQFVYLMANRIDRVEAFVFGTRLTRVTRSLRGSNAGVALAAVAAAVEDWGGGTRIGAALDRFNREWARRVLGRGAVVLILSDGCDRGDVALLDQAMARLQRSCHRLIWLNPYLGDAGYQPLVRGMVAALPYVDDFLPVHNLASLEGLVGRLSDISN